MASNEDLTKAHSSPVELSELAPENLAETTKSFLQCERYFAPRNSWSRWDGAQLWRRVYKWGDSQAGRDSAAFPTFTTEGGQHVVVYFEQNAAREVRRYLDAGGYCECMLTQCNQGKCTVVHEPVDSIFRSSNRGRSDRYRAALPSLLIYPPIANPKTEIRSFTSNQVDWDDVRAGDLGDPSFADPTEMIRHTVDYASNRGYVAGYPTWEQARYPNRGLVYGVIFIKSPAARLAKVYDSELPPPD